MEKVRTLFISDVHLGSTNSQPKKLLEVLKND
jgi:UDP-2,3-diacylglucosamine pyrophosphatase LpxH